MIDSVLHASKSDARLAALLDEACECAKIYLIAEHRPRGFEGTGEVVTLREEFLDAIEKLGRYCKEKGYLLEIGTEDPYAAAQGLTKICNVK